MHTITGLRSTKDRRNLGFPPPGSTHGARCLSEGAHGQRTPLLPLPEWSGTSPGECRGRRPFFPLGPRNPSTGGHFPFRTFTEPCTVRMSSHPLSGTTVNGPSPEGVGEGPYRRPPGGERSAEVDVTAQVVGLVHVRSLPDRVDDVLSGPSGCAHIDEDVFFLGVGAGFLHQFEVVPPQFLGRGVEALRRRS